MKGQRWTKTGVFLSFWMPGPFVRSATSAWHSSPARCWLELEFLPKQGGTFVAEESGPRANQCCVPAVYYTPYLSRGRLARPQSSGAAVRNRPILVYPSASGLPQSSTLRKDSLKAQTLRNSPAQCHLGRYGPTASNFVMLLS